MTDALVVDFASGDPHMVPEALFISALIDEGTYNPYRYGLEDEYFVTHKAVHQFCLDYARAKGASPTRELIERRFAGKFHFTPNIDADWAARSVKEAWASRVARMGTAQALHHLAGDEPDVEEAVRILGETARKAMTFARRTPLNFSENDPEPSERLDAIPLDPPVPSRVLGAKTLTTITGGITPGSLMYVAARLGVGKSWRLCVMALAAAMHGVRVSYYSLEMPRQQIRDRLRALVAAQGLTMDEWSARYDGTVDIYDPSITGPLTATQVAANHADGGLAIIDYIGLMRAANGSRAIDDWRNAASISNQLKEIALEHSIPIISAAQINREGAKASGGAKADHLAQSDALGQDADILLIVTEHSTGSHLNTLAKWRHGTHGQRWFSRFDPSAGDFGYLTPEQANDLKTRIEEESQL